MPSSFVITAIGGLFVVLCATHAQARAQEQAHETQIDHSATQSIPNTCSASGRYRIATRVRALAKDHEPEVATRLVDAWLCGDTIRSYRYVLSHTAETILGADTERYDAQGKYEVIRVPGSSIELIRKGPGKVDFSGLYDGGIGIAYSEDGTCSLNLVINPSPRSWTIVERRVLCD